MTTAGQRIAYFNGRFVPESEVLAEIYSEALESKGFRVIRQFDIGTRELVEPALERGLLELVPEYAGSALEFLGAAGPPPVGGAPTGIVSDPASAHASLVRAFAPRMVTVLAASPSAMTSRSTCNDSGPRLTRSPTSHKRSLLLENPIRSSSWQNSA